MLTKTYLMINSIQESITPVANDIAEEFIVNATEYYRHIYTENGKVYWNRQTPNIRHGFFMRTMPETMWGMAIVELDLLEGELPVILERLQDDVHFFMDLLPNEIVNVIYPS